MHLRQKIIYLLQCGPITHPKLFFGGGGGVGGIDFSHCFIEAGSSMISVLYSSVGDM